MPGNLHRETVGTTLTQAEYEATDGGAIVFASQATGDIAYASSTTVIEGLGIGSANQVLIVSGGIPAWSSNVNVQGTLDVQGATTLVSTLAVTGAVTLTSTIKVDDSQNIILGTGNDATIAYDGTDLIISPAAVGVGDVHVSGGSVEVDDNEAVRFGTGKDATISYDGTDLVVAPAVVGSGDVYISGGSLEVDDNESVRFGTGKDASILYNGTNLLIQPQDVGSGDVIINDAASLLINDTANANMAVGLTINQGANDDQIFTLKSSDVSTGLTTATSPSVEVDDYFAISKVVAANGGVRMQAIAESAATNGLTIDSWVGSLNTTKSTSGDAGVVVRQFMHNGANSGTNLTADGNVFAVKGFVSSAVRTLFIVDEDGDLFADGGTSTTNMVTKYDSFDDLSLVRAFDHATAAHGAKGLIRDEWDEFVRYNEDDLVNIGILGDTLENGGLVNVTRMQQLHNGALWQLGTQLKETQRRLSIAEGKLAALPRRA